MSGTVSWLESFRIKTEIKSKSVVNFKENGSQSRGWAERILREGMEGCIGFIFFSFFSHLSPITFTFFLFSTKSEPICVVVSMNQLQSFKFYQWFHFLFPLQKCNIFPMLNFVVSLGDYQRREAYGENTLGYFCY